MAYYKLLISDDINKEKGKRQTGKQAKGRRSKEQGARSQAQGSRIKDQGKKIQDSGFNYKFYFNSDTIWVDKEGEIIYSETFGIEEYRILNFE